MAEVWVFSGRRRYIGPVGRWDPLPLVVHFHRRGRCVGERPLHWGGQYLNGADQCTRCDPPVSSYNIDRVVVAEGTYHFVVGQFRMQVAQCGSVWSPSVDEPEIDPDSMRPRKGRWWDVLFAHTHVTLEDPCLSRPATPTPRSTPTAVVSLLQSSRQPRAPSVPW